MSTTAPQHTKRRSPAYLTMPEIAQLTLLSEAGLSDAGIGIVFGIYHGRPLAAGQVRGYRKRHAPHIRRLVSVGIRKDPHMNSPFGRAITPGEER